MKKRFWLLTSFTVLLALVVVLAGCSFGKKVAYQDGTFTATSDNETTEVELTLKENKIVAVNIREFHDSGEQKDIETYQVCVADGTAPLLAEAHPTLAQRIIDKNSWDVDTFSGATGTSNGVKEAAKKALKLAEK